MNKANNTTSNVHSTTNTHDTHASSTNSFINNPAFNNLSPEKLAFLMNFADSKKPTRMQEMMPFLMSSMNQAKKENIQFTQSESNLLIELLKQNLSPEEAHKVDMMMRIMHPKK